MAPTVIKQLDRCYSLVIFAILLFVLRFTNAQGNWLYLAIAGAHVDPPGGRQARDDLCYSLPGLSFEQRQLCRANPYAMPTISDGAREAILECQWQFKFERWNCTLTKAENDSDTEIFGTVMRLANKESAFISAVTSAAVVHSVTKACSAGNLTNCGCDNKYRRNAHVVDPDGESWDWGGCTDNVGHGSQFAINFLDRSERNAFKETRHARPLMNLHNNMVGRQAVESSIRKQCRCHGVSGSCELKTCWKQLPPFGQIGEQLKRSYDFYSVQIAKRAKKRLRRKTKSDRRIPLRSNELAYLNRSPDYCVSNESMGILGTAGRECNVTSLGADSCDLLCCGRGYNTRVETRNTRCSCKFVWCCYVKCKNCTENVDVHTCK